VASVAMCGIFSFGSMPTTGRSWRLVPLYTQMCTHTHRQPSINYICCSVEDYKKSSQDIWEL